MKVYVINLDKDKDRLTSIDSQLRKLGIAYERVPAVMGKDLSDVEKHSHVDYFRWWCAVGIPPRDGEIGCGLSHLSTYRKVSDVACVLEDDVVLDNRFPEVLAQVEKAMDMNRPQVVLLSNHSDPQQNGSHISGYLSSADSRFELKRTMADAFAEGYVINACAAAKLTFQNYPMITFADAWTRWAKNGAIELYHAFPTVCSQDKEGFASHTILLDDCLNVAKMSMPKWMLHKIKRVFGVCMDRGLVMLTGR